MDGDVENIKGIFRRSDITQREYRKVLSAVDSGEIIRLRKGVYATHEALLSSVVDIDSIVPDGILCLYSAWAYHQLTTQIPDAFYVAVRSKRRIVLPIDPAIQLVYVSDSILRLGVTTIDNDGIANQIYDLERSVCDAVKYRNKIGLDVMSEILNNYLSRENRNIKKLLEYAGKLRIHSVLNKYLEVRL